MTKEDAPPRSGFGLHLDPSVDGWEEILPFVDRSGAPPSRLREWALVLEARGVRHSLAFRNGRAALVVPPEQRLRAEEEVRSYEAENRDWPPRIEEVAAVENHLRTFAVLVALGVFHDLTAQPAGSLFGLEVDWHRLGSMDAGRLVGGDWWRAVTALTLHADGLHLAGNLVLGGVLLVLLNRQLGVGLGTALVLASGALGNVTNAFVRQPSHRSLGASTAVFGALGALVGRAFLGRTTTGWRRWVVPLGAGAGLLALTGVGEARTDYLAHLFGFGWGIAAGALTLWPKRLRRAPGRAASILFGFGALVAVVGAWVFALTR